MPKGEPLATFLNDDEHAAVVLLRERFGVDVARTPRFWEHAIAQMTGGAVTAHNHPWDVNLPGPPLTPAARLEVKFSDEFLCQFSQGPRWVMKFAAPRGRVRDNPADVLVLVGIDADDGVHCWAIPMIEVDQRVASITLTSPRVRSGKPGAARTAFDRWYCWPTAILPAVLKAYRLMPLRYDTTRNRGLPPRELRETPDTQETPTFEATVDTMVAYIKGQARTS